MTNMNVEVTPSCGKCGSNDLVIPDDMTDASVITCNTCGAENGTKGELIAASERLVAQSFTEDLQTALTEAFDGSNGVKFTKSGD